MLELRILHLDMDAFFASIEQRDDPQLIGKPVIVGGKPESRGVVSTASYEARVYGIHSGMPCKEALRLCPQAVFLPVNMKKYVEVSMQLREIFSRFTEIVEPLSVDEAFLEIKELDAVEIGRNLRRTILTELGLTASVGVSYNKFLAKLASDMNKPDGLTVIDRLKAEQLLPALPVRKLWGIGPKTEQELNQVGLLTFQDVTEADPLILSKVLGKRAEEIRLLSMGVDHRQVQTSQPAKSFGEETTLPQDTEDEDVLQSMLYEFSRMLSSRLISADCKARTITVKVRFDNFSDLSRSKTSNEAMETPELIYEAARSLFSKLGTQGRRIRLIGLQVSSFLRSDQPEQISFDFPRTISERKE